MVVLQGKGVTGGVVFGKLRFLKEGPREVARKEITDAASEIARYEQAKQEAIGQLKELYEKALGEVGEQGALLFDIHQMMLEDEDYCDSIRDIISRQLVSAEYAVSVTGDNFAKMFSEMDDAYMKERSADVVDISRRLIRVLTGEAQRSADTDGPSIICARDLTPSETVQMDKTKILAFVTEGGSTNSHTAILARTMGIPAVIRTEGILDGDYDNCDAAVDGAAGTVWVSPDEETLQTLREKKEKEEHRKKLLQELKGKPNVTMDGKEIDVCANIGRPSDLVTVLENDAGGIGLFRTEFLYLDADDYPSEEDQFEAYKRVAETMAGKRVVCRTLDIGADKQVAYFGLPQEENPALGMRAIRICLTRPELFRTQLRALCRASAFGKIAIMFPMIASVWEIRQARQIARSVMEELEAEGIAYDKDIEFGIMVETPAAAVLSDQFAKEVDFFSIGTNDLTQYTLAADRQNESIDRFCDTHHEAVLRLIRQTADNARQAGIWVGICGELAADLSLTETFIRMGIDELSVSPPAVLGLREQVTKSVCGAIN